MDTAFNEGYKKGAAEKKRMQDRSGGAASSILV